jgi:hypothetical protein
MKIFATKEFVRLARKGEVENADICEAIRRAESGSIDANLGSGVIKQRIARKGQSSKARGFRVILFYRRGDLAICLDLFSKSAKQSLTKLEEDTCRDLAKELAKLNEMQLAAIVSTRGWREIDYEQYQEEVSKRDAPIASPGG